MRPGNAGIVIRRGTFTAPSDIPFDKIKAIFGRTWAAKWLEIQAAHGFELATQIRVEKDPIPEIGDVYLGTSDTLRFRYTMVAGFKAEVKLVLIEDVPDDIASELVTANSNYQIVDSKRMI